MDAANVVMGKRKRNVAPNYVHDDPELDELPGKGSDEEPEEDEHVPSTGEDDSDEDSDSDQAGADSDDEGSSSDEGEDQDGSDGEDEGVDVEDLGAEVWKPVPHRFLPQQTPEPEERVLYEVSSLGRVRSLRKVRGKLTKTLLTGNIHQNQYHRYCLSRGGRRQTVFAADLVLGTFEGPYPGPKHLWHIDHKDQDMYNNVLTNLHYVKAKHNLSRGRKPRVRKGPSTANPKSWTYVVPERPDLLHWREHPKVPELEVAREGHVRYAARYKPDRVKQHMLTQHVKPSGHLWVKWKGTINKQDSQSVHRLVYRTWVGRFPANESAPNGKKAERLVLDHVDCNKANNHVDNLAFVPHEANCRKREGRNANNTSGVNGVHWRKDKGKWQASINVEGKRRNLGLFELKSDAKKARLAAEKQYWP